jgi:radical SAM superfamily enzyme YgiQ (UPF0313 family)
MMKILLIYPNFLEDRIHSEEIAVVPLGLYYVGALLKENNYDVEILNWYDIHKTPEKITETFKIKKPDIIGFSIVHANRWGAIDIARIAKKMIPHITIVFGGIGATFLWEHLLTHFTSVDYCVIGEGEFPFLKLVKYLENKTKPDPEIIPGLAYRKDGKAVQNPCVPFVKNLDDLPDPAKYFTFQHVAISRGCPGNCIFCGSPRFWGRRLRFHSARYFVDQLQRLYEKGIHFFFISDDTFALKKDLVINVCQEIIQRRLEISWAAICRVKDISDDVLYWMRRAGCIQISYGIESGSEIIRKYLNKPINTETIETAFALTTAYGILPRAYFIYGCPGETCQTIQETIDLIYEIKPLSVIFYILDIFPGTSLYEQFKKKTGLGDDIWLDRIEDILYFETDPKLSKEAIFSYGKKLRKAFHQAVSGFAMSIHLKDKPEFYPFHADFLSRLAMTFSHGDYCQLEEIKNPDEIACNLYRQAIDYYPDHRAYLGLGIIYQKEGRYKKSVKILTTGLKYFPYSDQLGICLGVSLMNQGLIKDAQACFERFPDSPQARSYASACKRM